MVLPKLFGKSQSPSKRQDSFSEKNRRPSTNIFTSSRSPSTSPVKSPRSEESTDERRPSTKRTRSYKPQPGDTHPLNLPPAERERRRSAMSYANGDTETEHQASEPVIVEDSGEQLPESSKDADFTNGDSSPVSLPHRTPAPPQQPAFDPEECKALGNKYFKARDYTKAIAEYTKGIYPEPSHKNPYA